MSREPGPGRVLDADGVEHVAGDYFRRMGDYLT